MSRTEGVTLPRLPTSHVWVTSPTSVQPHSVKQETKYHRRTLSEPSYTAYVGTPRQDVPPRVYCDAAMFDDVFDKKGKLLTSRNTPKISSPLHTLEYNSLHDPHCRKLFLNNKKLRTHLINLGLITDDLRVVANTQEQRQKIRSHELLERREQLMQKVEDRERQRLERLQRQVSVPKQYWESLVKEEERRGRAQAVRKMKVDKLLQAETKQQRAIERQREDNRQKLQQAMEEARLMEQARRNTARARQEMAERVTYERQYGKFGHHLANWHRDSDRIHNRMIIMEHKHWSKKRKQVWLSESYPLQSPHSTESSVIAVESVPRLPPISAPQPGSDANQREAVDTTQAETKRQLPSTEGDTAALLHPPPVPQSDTEQQETELVGQIVAESKDVLEGERGTGPLARPQETDGTPHPKAGTVTPVKEDHIEEEKTDEGTGVLVEGEDVRDEGLAAPLPQLEVVVLNPEQSMQELTHILIDALQRLDYRRTGFIHSDDFTQVLNSRDLGLQLDENQLLYVASQVDVYGNGWVPFIHIVPLLPDLLLTIYRQRAEEEIQQYGEYTEEQWCQLYPHSGSTCYFNKLTGVLQYGRPDDFRPFLKDDVFEDSIVDFFEIADANKDGVLEYDELYALLVSPMVSTRIYSNQLEQLLQLYQAYAVGGRMRLEEFVPVAKTLLLMIYQNAYPDVEEWIELDSRKCGAFWFNKVSGETIISSESYAAEAEANLQPVTKQPGPAEAEDGTLPPKARKKKRHSKAKRSTPEEDTQRPPSQGPPPLRRRSSKSRGSTHEESTDQEQHKQDHVQEESKEEQRQTTESSQRNDEVDMEMITSTSETGADVPNTEVDSEVQITVLGKQRLESIPEEDEEDVSEQSQRDEQVETQANKDGCGNSQDTVNQVSGAKEQTDQHKQDHDAVEQQSNTDCQDHPRQYSGDNSMKSEAKSSPETVNIDPESSRDGTDGSIAAQQISVETEGHTSHEHTHQLQKASVETEGHTSHSSHEHTHQLQKASVETEGHTSHSSHEHTHQLQKVTVETEGHTSHSSHEHTHQLQKASVETEGHTSHSSHEHTHQLQKASVETEGHTSHSSHEHTHQLQKASVETEGHTSHEHTHQLQKVTIETEGHTSHEHTYQLQDDSEQLVNTRES